MRLVKICRSHVEKCRSPSHVEKFEVRQSHVEKCQSLLKYGRKMSECRGYQKMLRSLRGRGGPFCASHSQKMGNLGQK